MDALQRESTELARKLIEAEGMLQRKLLEHESELEEMQSKLDEMKTELTAARMEEKELRSKEVRQRCITTELITQPCLFQRQKTSQIDALEAEIAKLTRALDYARVTCTNLQKQYQEQCRTSSYRQPCPSLVSNAICSRAPRRPPDTGGSHPNSSRCRDNAPTRSK
jgi:hypothetical protein